MLFATLLGALCTALLAAAATGPRKTKERVFYKEDSDEDDGRVKTVTRTLQRTGWLVTAFHEVLLETMAVKADELALLLEECNTNEGVDQAWAAYIDSVNSAMGTRAGILENELRKVYVSGYGKPVASERAALDFFRDEITRINREKQEEARQQAANKKKEQRKKEAELKKKEQEVKEAKREATKKLNREDRRRSSRGFTYADPRKVRRGGRRGSDSSSD